MHFEVEVMLVIATNIFLLRAGPVKPEGTIALCSLRLVLCSLRLAPSSLRLPVKTCFKIRQLKSLLGGSYEIL